MNGWKEEGRKQRKSAERGFQRIKLGIWKNGRAKGRGLREEMQSLVLEVWNLRITTSELTTSKCPVGI